MQSADTRPGCRCVRLREVMPSMRVLVRVRTRVCTRVRVNWRAHVCTGKRMLLWLCICMRVHVRGGVCVHNNVRGTCVVACACVCAQINARAYSCAHARLRAHMRAMEYTQVTVIVHVHV